MNISLAEIGLLLLAILVAAALVMLVIKIVKGFWRGFTEADVAARIHEVPEKRR